MKYRYCSETNAFYPWGLIDTYKQKNVWPENGIDVDEVVFMEYTDIPPKGKIRVTGKDGLPHWVNAPSPLKTDFVVAAENEKHRLMKIAIMNIAPLADAIELEIATKNEALMYTMWRQYRVLLNRVDTSTAPNIEWPIVPV